jgi:nucleoside-diphosphate-sugar epimerase
VIRLSDIADIAPAIDDREEVVPCDLADKQAVHQLVEGVDAILHFGGVSTERSFEEILGANICGVFHIYEAARRHGVKRVIFASSNHVIGFYQQDEVIDAHSLAARTVTTACPSPTAKTWPLSTSIATASRPSASASALRSRNRKTAG